MRWKYQVILFLFYRRSVQLYDIISDPNEQRNIAHKEEEVLVPSCVRKMF